MIYTFGYYGVDFEKFKATVKRLNAVVCDVRLVPRSRFFPAFNKGSLEKSLDGHYVHLQSLGNKGFREKRIEIVALDFGLDALEALGKTRRPVIVMCACKYSDRCHRKAIAEGLARRGVETKELEVG